VTLCTLGGRGQFVDDSALIVIGCGTQVTMYYRNGDYEYNVYDFVGATIKSQHLG